MQQNNIKAALSQNGGKKCESILTPDENKLFLSIDTKTKERTIDFFIKFLVNQCNDHKTSFLINIRNQVDYNSQVYKSLLKDGNLARAITESDQVSECYRRWDIFIIFLTL